MSRHLAYNLRFAQANNQWNISAELADDPTESAFARALTGGIKGVAMVSWWDSGALKKYVTSMIINVKV